MVYPFKHTDVVLCSKIFANHAGDNIELLTAVSDDDDMSDLEGGMSTSALARQAAISTGLTRTVRETPARSAPTLARPGPTQAPGHTNKRTPEAQQQSQAKRHTGVN
jgi:hypothetical protein